MTTTPTPPTAAGPDSDPVSALLRTEGATLAGSSLAGHIGAWLLAQPTLVAPAARSVWSSSEVAKMSATNEPEVRV